MSFLYSLLLKVLYPTSVSLLALVGAVVFHRRDRIRSVCAWTAIASLMIGGNGWVIGAMTRHLERQWLAPDPLPNVDCILVLGGGIAAALPPRSTVEVSEAGDRILHAGRLYRQGLAPKVLCTSGIAAGGIALRPPAEDMAELVKLVGVPSEAILLETESGNTREHAKNLVPVFQQHGFKRILLVTSAMHMPRSMGVFRRYCPDVEFIPAPTDFRVTDRIPAPWYRQITNLIPTPSSLALFSEAAHEYVGLFYYRVRGWL